MPQRKATIFMQKKAGQLAYCGDFQRQMYDALVAGLPEGQIVEITIAKRRHSKTSAQLGYWYGVLMPFAAEELRAAGYDTLASVQVDLETNKTTVDLMFKRLFQVHKNLERLPLKRDMTDEHMGELIDFVATWLAQHLHVTPPPPEKL